MLLISLLGGNFFGVAIASISGQAAEQDVLISAILVVLAETISRIFYSRRWRNRRDDTDVAAPLLLEALNGFKIGVMYALSVEAFKLGS